MVVDSSELFAGTSPEFRTRLEAAFERQSAPEGCTLFLQGDPARQFYLIEDGRVRLVTGDRGYTASTLSRPGDYIGWSTLVGRDAYSSTAQCLSATRLLRIDGAKLQAILTEFPADGMHVFRHLAASLGRRLTRAYAMMPTSQGQKESPSYG